MAHFFARQCLMQFNRLAQLLFDRMQRVERGHRLLENKADVIAAHLLQLGLGHADHLPALIGDRSADLGACAQQRHGAQRRDRFS